MLDGVRLLDLSPLLPGEFATGLLTQLGAEVIMVEHPDGGVWSRQYPSAFEMHNHSKKSVAIDLADERGRDAFLDLAATADVVVEAFRPGVVERLGVDYESVAERNPEVVYCSISSYGRDTGLADHPGHDINFYARAGLLHPGRDDGPSPPPGVLSVDVGTAAFVALSIVTALHGDGEYVDLSMQDVAVNMASPNLAEAFGTSAPERSASLTTGGHPCYAIYRCADDEYLSVGAYEPHFWERLCDCVGVPEYADDQWADGETKSAIMAELESRFAERPRDEWLEVLAAADVPAGPVNRLDEVPEDDVVQERGVVQAVPSEPDRDGRTVTFPALFEDHDVSVLAPPGYGQHSVELLRDVGYDDSTIDGLVADDVLAGIPDEHGAE